MDYAFTALRKMGAPPAYSRAVMEQLSEASPLPSKAAFAKPFFTRAIKGKNGRQMPQCIAHRGYKAKHPENTMAAFKGAVEAGVHALETDVHISKDDVVVLSHDATLERCYGIDKKIADCEWKFLSELRTTKEPHEPMPRLEDLFKFLSQPGQEKTWVLLDIKLDNDPDKIMRLIAETLSKVAAPKGAPWENRIILGCWAARYISPCVKRLPNFPIADIGFSIPYSRQFLNPALPQIAFNMLFTVLISPSGRRFIRDAKAADRAIYAWTVNKASGWTWCVEKELDGVITDEPKLFMDFCRDYELASEKERSNKNPFSWAEIRSFMLVNLFVWLFEIMFAWGFGFDAAEKLTSGKSPI